MLENLDRLEADTRNVHRALFSSTFPHYVVNALASDIALIRRHVCFRVEDGNFLGWEGIRDYVGCGQGNVNHVWNYAQTCAFLFPELKQTMRRVEFNAEVDEQGAMTFRSRKILGGEPWQLAPAADGQLGAIVRLYREWKISGDDQNVKDVWGKVVKALQYAMRE